MSEPDLTELITPDQADYIVEIMKSHRHSLERCEAVKKYLLTIADDWPAGVVVDDVAYVIISRAEQKRNGSNPFS